MTTLLMAMPGVIALLWDCLILLLICLILLIVYLVWQARRATTVKPTAKSKDEPATNETDSGIHSLTEELPTTFSGALDVLRSRAPGADFRYTVPWFLMLGPADAGKSSLISDSNLSTLVEEQISLEQGAGFTWNFFDHGLLIDVGGWALSSTADATSAWGRLLRMFLNNRPGRPLDGLVLAIPACDLSGTYALSPSALIERGAVLQQRLKQITQILSFQLPIYVILTKCDTIAGFSDFAAELGAEELQQIFGWSNPQRDPVAFHPEWVDEAIDSMRIALERKQGQIFAQHEPGPGRSEMFLFPGALFGVAPGLRLLLGRAMRGTNHAPPPLLRGIYCCGATNDQAITTRNATPLIPVSIPLSIRNRSLPERPETNFSWAANQIESWLQADLRIAFTHDLFFKKIFSEKGLATPLARHFAARDRVRVCLQLTSAAFFFILALGTGLAYRRLNIDQQHLIPLLETIESDLRTPPRLDLEVPSSESHAGAETLIHAMAGLQTQGFHSIFIPASWSDNVNVSIKEAMIPAFRVLVLQRFREGLDMRIHRIADLKTRPLPSLPLTSPNHVVQPFERIDQIPEYLQMQTFLKQVDQIHHFVAVYNSLSRHNSGSPVSSIIELYEYLLHRPHEFHDSEVTNPYFDKAVSEADWLPLSFAEVAKPLLSAKGIVLTRSLYQAWIENNPTRTATEQLAARLNVLALPSRHTYQELADARLAFTSAVHTYHMPDLQWTGAEEFVMPSDLAAISSEPLGNTEFFESYVQPDLLNQASEDFSRLSAVTDAIQTPLTGSLVKVDQGKIELSDQAQEMQIALDNLLNLSFMAAHTGEQVSAPAPMRYFTWDKSALEAAATLPANYQRYLTEDLGQAPLALRNAFSRIAAEQLSKTVILAIDAAQQPAPPITESSPTELVERAQHFASVQGTITSLEAALQQTNLRVPLAQLRQSSVTQASDLLLSCDRSLDTLRPYGVSTYAISRWTMGNRPTAQIFDAPTPDAVEAYLAIQRGMVENLAVSATPLVEFLRSQRSSLTPRTSNVLARWEALTAAVDQYKSKRPGNSIQGLEDLIAVGEDKFATSKSCDVSHFPGSTPRQTDYFSLENAQLRHELVLRCQALNSENFDRSYRQLAAKFNHDLAGRFPFAPLDASTSSEASPQLIAGIFGQLEAGGTLLSEQAADTPIEANIFLSQLEGGRPWFASLLSTATASQAPSLDLLPSFRVNREQELAGNQIIEWTLQIGTDVIRASDPQRKMHWTLGDPISLTFRWAKDAAYLPASATTPPHSGYDLTVSKDTVTYSFNDPWSLLRMIRTFTLPNLKNSVPNSPEPFTLAFSIPELPASASSAKLQPSPILRALIYIRLLISAPGEKQTIQNDFFPVAAPSLATPKASTSSRFYEPPAERRALISAGE